MPKVFAMVLAAGQGTRIGDAVPKQYIRIAGKPMMFHSIRALAAVPRLQLRRAQTPQMFRYDPLRRGLEKKPDATDESEAVETIGYSAPRLAQGENSNVKVTFAEDLQIAEMILQAQGRIEL